MKTNMDTMAAIFKLARWTGKNTKSFMIAGTKDKRGITTQKVCTFSYDPQKTQNQLKSFHMFKMGNFVEKTSELKLGDLQGNRFCLAIRELEGSPEIIKKSIFCGGD